VKPYANPKERFAASSRMVWTVIWAAIILQAAALIVGVAVGEVASAMTVLVVGVPSLIGAGLAWTGVTNWAEVRGMDVGYGPAPIDQSRQQVNVQPVAAIKPIEGQES
jgi:hypothetical protein